MFPLYVDVHTKGGEKWKTENVFYAGRITRRLTEGRSIALHAARKSENVESASISEIMIGGGGSDIPPQNASHKMA